MGVDGQGVVGGVEHLGERDEVEEQAGDGGGDGEMPPARAVVERRRQHRERGDAVEQDCDSEPEQGHTLSISTTAREESGGIGLAVDDDLKVLARKDHGAVFDSVEAVGEGHQVGFEQGVLSWVERCERLVHGAVELLERA